MKIKNLAKKLKNQCGQVAIFVGIAMVAIVGVLAYVIDTGSVYEARRTYQTIADSAALAGAQELPDAASARQAALDYAEMHGVAPGNVSISITSSFVSNDTIRVTVAEMDRQNFFAGIFGADTTDVGANATAMVGSPQQYNNIVPFGVLEDDWGPGREYTLKWPHGNTGNFGALSLGGTGANNYRKNIREGYHGNLEVGDKVYTEPGNMRGPTTQGTNDRINNYPDYTFNSFSSLTIHEGSKYILAESSDSQFVMCPLINEVPNGRKEVTILAFVPFIITSVSGSEVKGTFIDEALIITDGELTALDSHGIRVIRLID